MPVRRLLALTLVLAGLFTASAPAAVAEEPAGPRLAFVASHPYPDAGTEIATVDAGGGAQVRIVGGPGAGTSPIVSTRPSWSPDGSTVAFAGVNGAASAAIFVAPADGGPARVVPASRRLLVEGEPVFMPDGHSVAIAVLDVISGHFERLAGASARRDDGVKVRTAVWALGLAGGRRRLTGWNRTGIVMPSSLSADGSQLAATEWDPHRPDHGRCRSTCAVAAPRRLPSMPRNRFLPSTAGSRWSATAT